MSEKLQEIPEFEDKWAFIDKMAFLKAMRFTEIEENPFYYYFNTPLTLFMACMGGGYGAIIGHAAGKTGYYIRKYSSSIFNYFETCFCKNKNATEFTDDRSLTVRGNFSQHDENTSNKLTGIYPVGQ